MAAKNQYRTSDYIQWDTMLTLIRRLYRDGNYRMSLLIGCGCFFGLRISDLRTLTWSMLLTSDRFVLNEKRQESGERLKSIKTSKSTLKTATMLWVLSMTTRNVFSHIKRLCIVHRG